MVPPVAMAPKLVILPNQIGPKASIITLAHPRSQKPARYYFCPDNGLFEITRIAARKSSYRSWLLGPAIAQESGPVGQTEERKGDHNVNGDKKEPEKGIKNGFVSQTAELFTVTPVDPLFLLLPALSPKPTNGKTHPPILLFLSIEDILDQQPAASKHFNQLIAHPAMRNNFEQRMEIICDTVEAGDEKMYRINTDKLLQELLRKARKMVSSGLPPSMEERFITKALEPPLMGVRREENSKSEAQVISNESAIDPPIPETSESQTTVSSLQATDSQASTNTNLTSLSHSPSSSTTVEIRNLLRLRIALSYLSTSYLPSHLSKTITDLLSAPTSPVDFSGLDTHLSHLAKLRSEAFAARSVCDFSRKRNFNEDEDTAESRLEKKRKKEEEEKTKRLGGSKGVRDLKKVDTTGMKKMSAFFAKAAPRRSLRKQKS